MGTLPINVKIHSDFRDRDVPRGSIVTIGAPCQDLSVAGKRAGAERGLDALGLSVSAQRRLAGNAVVRSQARLMLQRGLTATNDTEGTL